MHSKKIRNLTRRHVAYHKRQIRKIKKHPFFLPITLFFVLFFGSIAFAINLNGQTTGASDTHVIQLTIEGQEQTIPTRAKTIAEFLTRAEITLEKGDVVEPAVDTEIIDENFKINVYRARPITIVEGNKKTQTLSAAPSPREVAESAGITVYPEDKVEASASADVLKDGVLGEKITITRSMLINLNVYGSPLAIRTFSATVNELLKEKNIVLAADDSVQPAPETPITANMQIFVVRKGIQIVVEEKEMAVPIEYIEDNSLSGGTSAVRQQGSAGKKVITYEIKLENGKEVSRKIIQEITTQEAVKRIVARGPQGSFGEALARLRKCEAGGNYATNTGNGYYGAYQYNISTWNNFGGFQYPHQAPAPLQDEKATETYKRRGWQPWPGCTAKLGLQDIYR